MANDTSTRWIDIEWEAIENANGYEVHLVEKIEDKEYERGIYRTDLPNWSKSEKPGNYLIKIRALDHRGAPGAWSPPIPFNISPPPVQLLYPLEDDSLIKSEAEINEIKFQWLKISGVDEYDLYIKDKQNNIIAQKRVLDTKTNIQINKIGDYRWGVLPAQTNSSFDTNSIDLKNERNFSIKGEKLKAPILEIKIIENKGVYIKWKEIVRATHYRIAASNLDESVSTQFFKATTQKTVNGIPEGQIPEGKWLYSIRSTAANYSDSNESRAIFLTKNKKTTLISNESIFNEENYRNLESSRISFSIGYPTVEIENRSYELDTINKETLRGISIDSSIDLNFFEKYNSFSKIAIGQFANSFSSLTTIEASSQMRQIFGNREINYQFGVGVNYKNLPNLSSNRLISPKTVSRSAMSSFGGTASLQLNKKWNEQLENEIYAELSRSFFKLSGISEIYGSNDTKLFFKTMYNINSQFNIHLTYHIKNLNNIYQAQTGNGSFALDGDKNHTYFKTNFLLFGTEYFF